MTRFKSIKGAWLRRWLKDEAGTATLEFAIMFPVYVAIFLSAVELGMVQYRHSMLERGLDMAVRDIRLTTGTTHSHDDIKQAICDYAGVLPNCTNNLRLEMIRVDPRAYVAPNAAANCIDHSEESSTPPSIPTGQENDTMLLRACFVFRPVFPTAGIGSQFVDVGAGYAALTAASAFVQEPR